MNIATEFPDYDVATLPAIPADWRDSSWHNDACPCFQTPNNRFVYTDYAEAAQREHPDIPRFCVRADDVDADIIYTGDDWDEVLKAVDKALPV